MDPSELRKLAETLIRDAKYLKRSDDAIEDAEIVAGYLAETNENLAKVCETLANTMESVLNLEHTCCRE